MKNNGYNKVANILSKWEEGDYDSKDAALELFSLPHSDLIYFIILATDSGKRLPWLISKRSKVERIMSD